MAESGDKSKADKLLGRYWDSSLEHSKTEIPNASHPQSLNPKRKDIGNLQTLGRQAEDILKKRQDSDS